MYSREERIKAVELWLKYGRNTATVIRELGYPSRKLLPRWYDDYLQKQNTGIVHNQYRRAPKYSAEQKQAAVDYYHEHGKCLARTICALRYPNSDFLSQWCVEYSAKRATRQLFSVGGMRIHSTPVEPKDNDKATVNS